MKIIQNFEVNFSHSKSTLKVHISLCRTPGLAPKLVLALTRFISSILFSRTDSQEK